jgi:glutathione peroxidase
MLNKNMQKRLISVQHYGLDQILIPNFERIVMPYLLWIFLLMFSAVALSDECSATLDFSLRPLAQEQPQSLCEAYKGQVLLVVNTASQCGFTPQYKGLEALYKRYQKRGLVVIGFPSNDFAQEPGSEQEIVRFCRLTYDVAFPMFEKIRVSGEGAHPFYQKLAAQGGGYPRWNFYKYLVDRDGQVTAQFPSQVRPDDPQLITAIEALL